MFGSQTSSIEHRIQVDVVSFVAATLGLRNHHGFGPIFLSFALRIPSHPNKYACFRVLILSVLVRSVSNSRTESGQERSREPSLRKRGKKRLL
jgi:hypothetical protein